MTTVLKKTLKFITDPKNTRMLLLAGIVILLFLLLQQCNAKKGLRNELEAQKTETQRISNNFEASKDTIRQFQLDKDTWRAEKSGYELTLEELETEYAELLGKFNIEKNKPPRVVIQTEYVVLEKINNVPILLGVDSLGNKYMTFYDSIRHNSSNYRILDGRIGYDLVFNTIDSTYKFVPGPANFGLELGMNLNLGLFQDKKTKKISIVADTDYPGITFTKLEGASIMDDPNNRKILRSMRKPWGIGLNAGYGAIINPASGTIGLGPYVGVGLSYSPKFLQWGK
jgi:hypothetical protein